MNKLAYILPVALILLLGFGTLRGDLTASTGQSGTRPLLRVYEDGSGLLRTAKEHCVIPAYDSAGDQVRCWPKNP